jgi:hypothetical protein
LNRPPSVNGKAHRPLCAALENEKRPFGRTIGHLGQIKIRKFQLDLVAQGKRATCSKESLEAFEKENKEWIFLSNFRRQKITFSNYNKPSIFRVAKRDIIFI